VDDLDPPDENPPPREEEREPLVERREEDVREREERSSPSPSSSASRASSSRREELVRLERDEVDREEELLRDDPNSRLLLEREDESRDICSVTSSASMNTEHAIATPRRMRRLLSRRLTIGGRVSLAFIGLRDAPTMRPR
jgi:hypothetical protein